MAIAEIFTQQRNHSARKRNGGRTPTEATNDAKRPIEVRSALEQMKDRFEKENANIETKWKLIERPTGHWGMLSNESIEKMKKELEKYPVPNIISACASFMCQVTKHPDNKYGPEYFMAILRNKREEDAKRVYNEVFRAGVDLCNNLTPPPLSETPEKTVEKVHDILKEVFEKPTPSEQLLHLESMAWWMVSYSEKASLSELWKLLEKYMERSIQVTLKTWSQITEFFFSRLGSLLYNEKLKPKKNKVGPFDNIAVFH